ncbi:MULTISPECIES: hypothetical protein [Burkholderia cepacia complex]|uniref:hypothetical protein n=1 Tax=Burkholderia cepacia complex TaxID=87882 RepID=UPI00075D2221|nr:MULTISPECIES: hypothetical protein [Burkholderia cepacia complex]KVF80369.1 hypothetical protein WJ18_11505 [Burkholderia vietnamiensis]KVF85556.1 hypothetical protein WJ19_14860 [Burkholderia vietnamiensis]KVF94177.1 hypothetical protein WJ20_03475 [Burkholderia vietnamiensis]KVF98133.1 hypothetical protein WJ22_20870 [Burkholderia vietnamiensis]
MMTLRLPEEIEAELELHCKRNGITKNAAVTEATKRLLATPDIAKLELAEKLDEPVDAEERYKRRLAKLSRQYELEVAIAGWIAEQVVWTKKSDPSGKVRPGMIGRNTIVGFCDTMWAADGTLVEGVFIIAEHHSGRAAGIQAHHRYVMPYELWCEHMRIVPRA